MGHETLLENGASKPVRSICFPVKNIQPISNVMEKAQLAELLACSLDSLLEKRLMLSSSVVALKDSNRAGTEIFGCVGCRVATYVLRRTAATLVV